MILGLQSAPQCEIITHVNGRTMRRPVLVLLHDGLVYHAWSGRLAEEIRFSTEKGLSVSLNPCRSWSFPDAEKLSNGVVLEQGKGFPVIPSSLHIVFPRPVDIEDGVVPPEMLTLNVPQPGNAKIFIGKRLVKPWVLHHLSPETIRDLQFARVI